MTTDETAAQSGSPAGPLPFDTAKAHQARIYDYLLGGKDNYAADRAAVEAALKVWPELVFTARANRRNADHLDHQGRVLTIPDALQHLALDNDMRILADVARKFRHPHQLYVVCRQALKALRRRIDVLGLVQSQYGHRVDAAFAGIFAKMQLTGKSVLHLQPQARSASHHAAG